MQRLTQWCPANAKLSGNMDFTKLTAWREGSVEDGVTHSAQGAIGRCGLLKALDRHPVSQYIVYCRLSPTQNTPAMKETGLALGHRLRRGRKSVRHTAWNATASLPPPVWDAAIETTTASGILTRDVGGTSATEDVTKALIDALAG